ncbi:MAG TPA: ATP-binding protein [Puia sp.]|nr:ATP-binding protein [Puia sp.]
MKLGTQIFLGFLIAISIDLIDSFVNYTLTLKVKRNLEFLDRSELVIRRAATVNTGILRMQTAFRGFLLTKDESSLDPYFSEKSIIAENIREVRAAVSLPGQRELLDSIARLHQDWVGYADTLIAARRSSLTAGAAGSRFRHLFDSLFRRHGLGRYNVRISAFFRTFDNVEYRKREELRNALAASVTTTDRYSLIFSILLVIVGAGIALYLVRVISSRINSLVWLAGKIAKGDFGMVKDNKRDELSHLTVSLNAMSLQLSRNISELEKKNTELNQFAYVVSHDLKAPVRGISNVVSWIKEDLTGEISPAMQKYLDYIPDRIKRMEDLIDGILAYARAGREGSPVAEVDVAALIRELAEYLVPPSCTLNVGTLPVILTQRLPLQQVFSNLIGNAVKYSNRNGAVISIACQEFDNHYEFSVQDNGPGIPKQYHEKVFGLFQTLREKDDRESTGIGLSIVRKIVEERGGLVRLVSSPGDGSIFIFTWPK